MKKRLLALLLVLPLTLGALAACDNTPETTAAPEPGQTGTEGEPGTGTEGEPIKFGLLAPLTGTNAEYGQGFEIATKMAADEINSNGGINGRPIEIVVSDSKGEPKESSILARQFADDSEIMAIIGDFTSGASMANAPIVDEAGLVQLSPTASNPDYAGMSDYTFGIMGRQADEGPFFANYILAKKMGAKKVGVIYINSDWGQSSYKALTDTFEEAGLELVADANYVDGESDFSSVVTKVRAGNPDTIVILDQGAVPKVLTQMQQSGWTDVQISTLGPGASEQLIELSADAAENLYTSTPFFFDPTNEDDMAWAEAFEKEAGFMPTVHPVCAYDCVYVLAEAIRKIDGDITREAIREQVAATDYTGMTGPIKFNPAGDISRKYIIAQVQDSAWVQVEGYDYAD